MSLIKGFEIIDEIILAAAYFPWIDVTTPEGILINAIPGNTTELPIVIENLGNGKTTFHNNIIDYPKEWKIIIPSQVVLEVNESKEVNPSITPPENFTGIEAIKIVFTPNIFTNLSLKELHFMSTLLSDANHKNYDYRFYMSF